MECIGYPINTTIDYRPVIESLRVPLNNVGDPVESACPFPNTRRLEKSVIDLFGAYMGLYPRDIWGFVTCGGTESNIQALSIARDLYPGAPLYYSEQSHYSISKAARLLRMETVVVPACKATGVMNVTALGSLLPKSRSQPVIIVPTLGTTFHGGIDDINAIGDLLEGRPNYVHCDAAFFGGMLPFIEDVNMASVMGGVHSISISGHKFLGTPFPCSIFMASASVFEFVKEMSTYVDVVGGTDYMMGGSRSGHAPIFLNHALKTVGRSALSEQVADCLSNAEHLVEKARKLGIHAYRANRLSPIVVFPRLHPDVRTKWGLACQGKQCHVVVMPQTTREMLGMFLMDVAVRIP